METLEPMPSTLGSGFRTYNLFIAQKLLTMPEAWKTKTIKMVRWLLVEVGGKACLP